MRSLSPDSTNFRMAPKYPSKSRRRTTVVPRTPPPAADLGRARGAIVQPPRRRAAGETVRESVSPIYYPASRHFAADGRDSSGWIRGLHAIAGLGVARSGLPHHSGGYVLSRRES